MTTIPPDHWLLRRSRVAEMPLTPGPWRIIEEGAFSFLLDGRWVVLNLSIELEGGVPGTRIIPSAGKCRTVAELERHTHDLVARLNRIYTMHPIV